MSVTYALEVVVQRADGAELENEQSGKCQRALANKGNNIAVRLARAHDANLVVEAVYAVWRGAGWQALDCHLLTGRVCLEQRTCQHAERPLVDHLHQRERLGVDLLAGSHRRLE